MGRYPDGAVRAEGRCRACALAAAGAPADLLERRPDVLAAENRMRSAGFRIHEARAAMLPRLTLTGSARAKATAHDIDDIDDLITNVTGGLAADLPTAANCATRPRRVRRTARRRRRLRRTALAAWREVEGAISADQSLEVRERDSPSPPKRRARRRSWPSANMHAASPPCSN